MFYQLLDGQLLSGPYIFGPGWQLVPEERDTYAYPAYGWHWFETEAEAREFFGLPPAEPAPAEEAPDVAE
jgi:hypothetical protein